MQSYKILSIRKLRFIANCALKILPDTHGQGTWLSFKRLEVYYEYMNSIFILVKKYF